MDAKKIYEIAKESVVKIKAAVPSYSAEEGMEFCVIADADGNLFSAMTNITVKDNSVERIPADIAAFLYMKNTGSMVAKYIIVLSVADRRIIPPSEECFDLMFRTNSKNDECVVVLSSSEQKPLSELRLIGDGTDLILLRKRMKVPTKKRSLTIPLRSPKRKKRNPRKPRQKPRMKRTKKRKKMMTRTKRKKRSR